MNPTPKASGLEPLAPPLATSFGFALGFVGGMALYYLSHPEASHKLKAKLLELYHEAKHGSVEAKDALLAEIERYAALLPDPPLIEFTPPPAPPIAELPKVRRKKSPTPKHRFTFNS